MQAATSGGTAAWADRTPPRRAGEGPPAPPTGRFDAHRFQTGRSGARDDRPAHRCQGHRLRLPVLRLPGAHREVLLLLPERPRLLRRLQELRLLLVTAGRVTSPPR